MGDEPQKRRSLDGAQFEVAVIGGGINGVAIARLCAAAGRRTVLIEQNDFASGTTSRSTRIIHGGLRYLEHGEIGLVRESLRERERLLRAQPHLVRPMRFLLALPSGRRNALEIRFGLWLYRLFARVRVTPNGDRSVADLERLLDRGRQWNVFQYDDAQCEFPERLVAEWLTDAVANGTVARNYMQALQVDVTNGRAHGLRLRDRLDGCEFRIEARWIINASGPWADSVARRAGIRDLRMVGGVRGSHLVLPRFPGAPESAVYTEALDGRPIFVIPWNGELLVGTTEEDDAGNPSSTQPSQSEIEYLLKSMQRLFPAVAPGREDIHYAIAGVRPLPFSPGNPLAAITRRHVLHDHRGDGAEGMISLIGGKLTTAASVARECARKIGIEVAEPMLDEVIDIGEIENALGSSVGEAGAHGRIKPETARALAGWFGRSATDIAHSAAEDERRRVPICDGSPHIVAEAMHAMNNECAITLGDVLLRRVPLALAGAWSEDHTRQAAQRIGRARNWSSQRIASEVEEFEAEREQFLIKVRQKAPA
ncbi:MAG TPA: glycerol-3-phosphate dehydrogenase/oxidase [Terriglobales bacterium]|nr:glycerol-3-phosphate dehydrogenase/oxidase [Terriglobales bacterium]